MSGAAPEDPHDADPIATLVRDHDPDRWAASLFWPSTARPDALALMAFDAELTRIADIVSEPMLGEIRMQWWQDAIAAGNASGHPVATALIATLDRYNLDREAFGALIAGRQAALFSDPYIDIKALDAHLDATDGTLFRALARVLAPGRVPPPAIDPAARAYGLTQRLRRLPRDLSHGRQTIPLDLLERFGVPPAHLLERRMSPALRIVIGALLAHVRDDITAFTRSLPGGEPGLSAALPTFLCPAYLKRIEKPGFDIFNQPIAVAPWRRLWILWRGARRLP